MLEPPQLDEDKILSSLNRWYGQSVVNCEFLPIGYDATAWVYRVEVSDGQEFFLKLKKGLPKPAMLFVPNHLHTVVGMNIAAPIPSLIGKLTAPVDDLYNLILYPFVRGKNGGRDGMTLEYWESFGKQLRSIHEAPLSQALLDVLPKETFVSHKLEMFLSNFNRAKTGNPRDEHEAQLMRLWEEHHTDIVRCYERMLALGTLLQSASLPQMICHADCHPYNLMLLEGGQVMIIDWDEVIYAPKERDLMFIGSWAGDIDSPAAKAFYRGYGAVNIRQEAIAYYRYEWAIQEFAEYSNVVFFRQDFSDETKRNNITGFADLFSPNNVVALAYRDDITG